MCLNNWEKVCVHRGLGILEAILEVCLPRWENPQHRRVYGRFQCQKTKTLQKSAAGGKRIREDTGKLKGKHLRLKL